MSRRSSPGSGPAAASSECTDAIKTSSTSTGSGGALAARGVTGRRRNRVHAEIAAFHNQRARHGAAAPLNSGELSPAGCLEHLLSDDMHGDGCSMGAAELLVSQSKASRP